MSERAKEWMPFNSLCSRSHISLFTVFVTVLSISWLTACIHTVPSTYIGSPCPASFPAPDLTYKGTKTWGMVLVCLSSHLGGLPVLLKSGLLALCLYKLSKLRLLRFFSHFTGEAFKSTQTTNLPRIIKPDSDRAKAGRQESWFLSSVTLLSPFLLL